MALSKKQGLVVACAMVALVTTSGCTRIRGHQGYIVDDLLVQGIKPGIDTRDSVEGTLGRPTFAGEFDAKDWYYVSRTTKQFGFARPSATEQTILHVRFDDAGNVVTVQKTGLEKIASISPYGDTTPTLGRKRGFFQELFGNIGTVGVPGAGGGGAPQ